MICRRFCSVSGTTVNLSLAGSNGHVNVCNELSVSSNKISSTQVVYGNVVHNVESDNRQGDVAYYNYGEVTYNIKQVSSEPAGEVAVSL